MRTIAVALVCLLMAGCLTTDKGGVARPSEAPLNAIKPGWPPIEDAQIRPGSQVVIVDAQCTANFVFESADNSTLYLGVAAHCFGSKPNVRPVGTKVRIDDLENAGTVAYNGWSHDDSDFNDFGLVKIDANMRKYVHPAMLYWGGPTSLGFTDQVTPGTRVVTYGHSIQRADNDPDNAREGRVLGRDGDLISVVTNHPGIRGDSGSGLMDADGAAIGILSTGVVRASTGVLAEKNEPTINNYVELDTVMSKAAKVSPEFVGLRVATFRMFESPSFIAVPDPFIGSEMLPQVPLPATV